MIAYEASEVAPDPTIVAHVSKVLQAKQQEETDANYFALLESGMQRFQAARALGLDPLTIKRRLKHDAQFRELVKLSEEISMEEVLNGLVDVAKHGDTTNKVRAALKLLEAKSPDEFAGKPQTQVNVQVNNSGGSDGGGGIAAVEAHIRDLENELRSRRELRAGTTEAETIEDVD